MGLIIYLLFSFFFTCGFLARDNDYRSFKTGFLLLLCSPVFCPIFISIVLVDIKEKLDEL